MPEASQPYREPSSARESASPAVPEDKPYKVIGKTEWEDSFGVHLEKTYGKVTVNVDRASFHETTVGDYVFVRLEKAPPLPGRPIPGPGRDSRP